MSEHTCDMLIADLVEETQEIVNERPCGRPATAAFTLDCAENRTHVHEYYFCELHKKDVDERMVHHHA